MRKGQIMEQGTHASLVAANGAYARLVHAQDLATGTKSGESSDSEADNPDDPEMTNATEMVKT